MDDAQEMWMVADEISGAVDRLEQRLNHLIREGAHAGRNLVNTVADLEALVAEVQPQYLRLQELLTPRDLSYQSSIRLGQLRERLLWLYRKAQLERLFFAKLQLERTLRDEVYRKIMETYDEFSELEEREQAIKALDDEELAASLQREQAEHSRSAQGETLEG